MHYVNNDVAADAALTVAGINATVADVYGVDFVRPRTLLNGDVDLAPAAGGYYIDAANEILAEIVVVE